ncbi:septum site-determining protein MinD, partial [Vibrio parahaemolyticus V-223/04]
ATQTAF